MSALSLWVQGHAVAAIIVGTLLIAAGGLITTMGWNAVSSSENLATLRAEEARRLDEQRAALRRTLLVETRINQTFLQNAAYVETDEDALGRIAIYPPLQRTAVAAAIASGLFATADQRELYGAISGALIAIGSLEAGVSVMVQDMLRVANNRDEEVRRREIAKLRVALRDSPMVKTTRTQLERLTLALSAAGSKTDTDGAETSD